MLNIMKKYNWAVQKSKEISVNFSETEIINYLLQLYLCTRGINDIGKTHYVLWSSGRHKYRWSMHRWNYSIMNVPQSELKHNFLKTEKIKKKEDQFK